MDPLSIIASIIAISGAVGQVSRGLRALINLRQAPTILDALVNEISDLQAVLESVRDLLKNHEAIGNNLSRSNLLLRLKQNADSTEVLVKTLDQFIRNKLTKKNSAVTTAPSQLQWSRKALLRHGNSLEHWKITINDQKQKFRDILSALTTSFSNQILLEVHRISLCVRNQEKPQSEKGEESWSTRAGGNGIGPEGSVQTSAPQQTTDGGSQEAALTSQSYQQEPMNINELEISQQRSPLRAVTQSCDDDSQAVRFETSVQHNTCEQWCNCQCHASTQLQTPLWMRNAIGQLFMGYSAIPCKMVRPCDKASCQRRFIPRARINYYFPVWFLARKFYFHAIWKALEGPELLIRLPRVVGPSALIFWYAGEGDLQGIQGLLTGGHASVLDVSATDGVSALQIAIRNMQMASIRFLLNHGADTLMEDDHGVSPSDAIWDKILSKNIAIAEAEQLRLLFKDSELSATRGFSTLHQIVLGISNASLSVELEKSPYAVDSADFQGRTAISWAAARGDIEAVRLLIRFNANVHLSDNQGMSPLHHAAKARTPSCLRPLLCAGAPVHKLDVSGRCALAQACRQSNSLEYLAPLLDFTPNADNCVHNGTHILHLAIAHDRLQSFRLLLQHGARIDTADREEFTTVMWAVCQNSHRLLPIVLEGGARLDSKTKLGQTVLHFVATRSDAEIMRMIRSANLCGVDVYADSVGEQVNAQQRFECRLSEKRPKDEENMDELVSAWQSLWETAQTQNPDQARARGVHVTDSYEGSHSDQFVDAVEVLPAA